jgi:hypothetical protein
LEVLHNDVFVVEIGTSTLAFMLAAGCEHSTSWGVMWSLYYFANKSKSSVSNHVSNTWNVVEHLANLLISDMAFLNFCYGDVENSTHTAMKKYFKLSEKGLSK